MSHLKIPFNERELLELRQAGRLPRIGIAGDEFIVVIEKMHLALETDRRVTIDLDCLALSEDRKSYLFFYNPQKKAVVYIPENITKMPGDIVLVEIPIEQYLDPVGLARSFGQPDNFLLDSYPLKAYHQAKLTAIEASGLVEMVRNNREKKKAQGLRGFLQRRKDRLKRT